MSTDCKFEPFTVCDDTPSPLVPAGHSLYQIAMRESFYRHSSGRSGRSQGGVLRESLRGPEADVTSAASANQRLMPRSGGGQGRGKRCATCRTPAPHSQSDIAGDKEGRAVGRSHAGGHYVWAVPLMRRSAREANDRAPTRASRRRRFGRLPDNRLALPAPLGAQPTTFAERWGATTSSPSRS